MERFTQKSTDYTGEIHVEAEMINMEELFASVTEELTGGWKGSVKLQVETKNPELYCDPVHIKEVLCNLVSNSLDAMGDEGTLTLSYRTPKKDVALIQVMDTGCGIAPENIDRIFEMYYSSYSDPNHFGMGLPYCRNVIKAHGGYISVKSSTDPASHGTEFTLCLPRRNRTEIRHKRKEKSSWKQP